MATAPKYMVSVVIGSPQGTPLIRNPKKPAPLLWRLPGGKSNSEEEKLLYSGEMSEEEIGRRIGSREVKEETGIELPQSALWHYYATYSDGNHIRLIFIVWIDPLPPYWNKSPIGEEVRIFSAKEIPELEDFHPKHLEFTSRAFQVLLREHPTVQ